MKLKDLKKLLDSLPSEELEKDLLYNSKSFGLSGVVSSAKQISKNLYYDGSDDPATLHTKSEWRDLGYSDEEIYEMTIEIPEGSICIEF